MISNRTLTTVCLTMLGVIATAQSASAIVWTGNINANWSNPGNWSGGVVPNAIDAVADVSNGASTEPDVDTDIMIGRFNVSPSGNTPLDIDVTGSYTLTYDVSAGQAYINTRNKNLRFNVDVALNDDLLIGNAAGNGGSASFNRKLTSSNDIHIAPTYALGETRINLGTADLSGFTGDIYLQAQTTPGEYAPLSPNGLTATELLNTTVYMGQDSVIDPDRSGTGVLAADIVLQGDGIFWSDGNKGGFKTTGIISGPGDLTIETANGGPIHNISGSTGPNTFLGDVLVHRSAAGHVGGIVELSKDGAFGLAPGVTVGDDSTLRIASGGTDRLWDGTTLYLEGDLDLDGEYGNMVLQSGVFETVAGLLLDGISQPVGTYGSTSSAATYQLNNYFSGPGLLNVVPLVQEMIPEPSTLLVWSLLAGLGVGLGWRRRV